MLIDFEDIKHKLNNSKWYGTQAWYEILNIIGDCDDKSRPTGKWVGTSFDGYADGYPVYDEWECSECGNEISTETPPPYCDCCGSRNGE